MVVSTQFVYFEQYGSGEQVRVDGSRIGAAVVTGIGFLVGGATLRTEFGIQGLTTARVCGWPLRSGWPRAAACP